MAFESAPHPSSFPGGAARELDDRMMWRALELAARGEGRVEPNPMVGCVVARGARIVGEGWHGEFGGPHAEVRALEAAGPLARDATLYVTLEPCCHVGKTPPCTVAILAAGVRRVVAAQRDPFALVDGRGLDALAAAGIAIETGVGEDVARQLNLPYFKLVKTGRPWIIAKWAMTLDGKLATAAGDSQWISSEGSRRAVHEIRGRMDAILVGRGTADADNPRLTARPLGPRVATRIALSSSGILKPNSHLLATAREQPVLIGVADDAREPDLETLRAAGCEVFVSHGQNRADRLAELFEELGRRKFTNVLVEGGSTLLGCLFEHDWVDEVHVFVAPKVAGGRTALSPVGGEGKKLMSEALAFETVRTDTIDGDWHFHGRRSARA